MTYTKQSTGDNTFHTKFVMPRMNYWTTAVKQTALFGFEGLDPKLEPHCIPQPK